MPKLLAAQRGRRTKGGAARARKAARRLKTIAGRVVRQLDAAVPNESRDRRWVETAKKILSQKRSNSGKIYSLHEPEVYCVSKGKEHKKYEFGAKASVVVGKNGGVILGNGVSVHFLSKIELPTLSWLVFFSGMARSIRLEFGGAFYHVMARGNRREAIFLDDVDRRFFLGCVGEACGKTGWMVHAWVLMGNHYHLLIETPEPNLVEGMKWLQNTYTRRFNVRHRDWGRLFGDRYKAVLVEGESPQYYGTLWDYIHLNPCRAGLVDVTQGASVLDYPWSSLAGGYALSPHQRPKWLAAERGLSLLGVADDVAGRRALVERLDRRAAAERDQSGRVPVDAEADRRGSHLRRGWYWGTQAFAERLVKLGEAAIGKRRRARGYVGSRELAAHGEAEALKMLAAGLKAAGFAKEDLAGRPCTDPCKVMLAFMLWKKTTVSQAWIAEKLEMKNPANVSRVIHRMDGEKIAQKVPAPLAELVGIKMKENAH